MAATVNRPTKRCSIALVPGVFADHDDVGVGAVAQEAGDRGLRQHQQIVAVGQLREDLRREPQHAEAARRSTDDWPSLHRAALVAQQHEVPVGEPAQQRGDVLAVRAGEPSLRVGVEFVGQAEQRRRSSPASPARPAARRRARWAAAARPRRAPWRSTDGDSWTWIQASSMPSGIVGASEAGRMSSSSPVGPRRTRNTGFMIAL